MIGKTIIPSISAIEIISSINLLLKQHNISLRYCEDSELSGFIERSEFGELKCKYSLDNNGDLVGLSLRSLIDIEIEPIFHLKELTGLKKLMLSGSNIINLSIVKKLTQLTVLDCRFTGISSLEGIENLSQLTSLVCNSTKISNLEGIENLSQLTSLYCSETETTNLDAIQKGVEKLTNLRVIDASNCNINKISSQFIKLNLVIHMKGRYGESFKNGVYLAGNPIYFPPIEIIARGQKVMESYFDSLQGKTSKLNEAKLILVGEGAAGKTSLINHFINNEFNPSEDKTDGIAITTWTFEVDKEKIKLHCWDFGGQEIMRATHQLFLSERCIYIVVLDGRKDENPEQWLKQVTSVSSSSPIFVISNKVDEHYDNNLTQQQLRKKYPQIIGFYRTSCKTGEGINKLINKLKKEVTELGMRQFIFAQNWIEVKKQLEVWSEKKNHITYDRFTELCIKNDIIDKGIQEILLVLLHDLGLVIHFKKLVDLQTQVLNPSWITEGIYVLLNSDLLSKQQGIITKHQAETVLENNYQDERYRNKAQYLMSVMEQFELCYQIHGDSNYAEQKYLIPDLLPTELTLNPELSSGIAFIYKYGGYLPPELMARFIVKSHEYQVENKCWRNGVLLSHPKFNSEALIIQDKEDRMFRIVVKGEGQRDFLTIIRNYFSEIHKSYQQKNIALEEFLPLKLKGKESWIKYSRLIKIEKRILQGKEKDRQYDDELDINYSVAGLLDGIQAREGRHKQYKMDKKGINVNIENNFKPVITQKNNQENTQTTTQQTTVTISVEIKTFVSSLKNWNEDILDDLQNNSKIESDPQLQTQLPKVERELNKVNYAMESLGNIENNEQAQENIGKFTRVFDFIKDSIDGTNNTGMLLKKTGESVVKLQSLGKQYNKIAQYFALPQVPDIFLG